MRLPDARYDGETMSLSLPARSMAISADALLADLVISTECGGPWIPVTCAI
ncbi:hypothetical protein SAMN05421539_10634 [Jannaschia seohaensis]|uniref:Uncharacterized protein n=1 Tax=Jannaschia seohaensis TaxID=475081 RepID=A0A2Y9AY53_9RHOB|nr:hypothetical protein BCF38_10634 [Jannaschia seohaensis]SSA47487.1 hypothetical protein SAMN05421539_10634 [Jannaschia seohaensis]